MSLAQAREQRDAAKKQIAARIDPALDRKLKKLAAITAAESTFKTIAEEWLEKLTRETVQKHAEKDQVVAPVYI